MEETKKLFTQNAIAVATYIGGPMAAGYLVKRNFDAQQQEKKGLNALFIGIIFTLLLLVLFFSLPEYIFDSMPRAVIPLIYTAIIYFIVEKTQGKWLREHKETGGEFYSTWKAAGIGAIFLVILSAFIFGVAYLSEYLSEPDFDAATYNLEFEKFAENENKALEVFNYLDSKDYQFLIDEFKKGTVLWKENLAIVGRMDEIENLPADLATQNRLLISYCKLRIQHNDLMLKSFSEDTDKYLSEILKVEDELNYVLDSFTYSPN